MTVTPTTFNYALETMLWKSPRADTPNIPPPVLMGLLGVLLVLSTLFAVRGVAAMIPVGADLTSYSGGTVGFDFSVFYTAAALASEGLSPRAYDTAVLHDRLVELLGDDPGHLAWRYPPPFLLLLQPLAQFDYLTAFWIWTLLSWLAVGLVAWLLTGRTYGPFLALICPATVFSAYAGQNGNLSAAIIGGSIALLGKHPRMAGMLLGLLVYKPQLALIVPFCLLAARQIEALAWMIISSVGLVLISLAVHGIDPWIAFLDAVSSHSDNVLAAPHESWYRVPTMPILGLQITDNRVAAWIMHGIGATASVIAACWIWARTTDPLPRALAITSGIPLLTPYAWDYDMAILIVPFLLLAARLRVDSMTYGSMILALLLWTAAPAIQPLSKAFSWQVGPILWICVLGYALYFIRDTRNTSNQGAGPASHAA